MRSQQLNVFVYGTLKRGERNHGRFCQGVLSVEAAVVQGRLYDLPYGFPALVVPEANVRASGTTDYHSDAEKQHYASSDSKTPSVGWDTVCGELLYFDDPERRLAALDVLEGYVPGEKGFYERVLVPVEAAGEVVLAWVYRVERTDGVYLPGGRWPTS